MQKLGGTGALLVSVAAVLLIAVVGWIGFVSPQRSKAGDLDSQYATAQSQLTAAQRLLATTNTRQNLAVLRAASRALPDTPQMSQILRQLAAATATSHTELDGVTPSPAVAGGAPGAEAVPLAVTVKGRYFALQHLLGLLRLSADVRGSKVTGAGRLYTVDGIQFGAAGSTGGTSSGASDQGAVTATITMNAFVYAPSAAPATAAASTATDTTSTAGTSQTSAVGATN
jgi:hypothetical protein